MPSSDADVRPRLVWIDENDAEAEVTLGALREGDPEADVVQLAVPTASDSGELVLPALPVLVPIIIAASFSVAALAVIIQRMICHAKKAALIVDATGVAIKIHRTHDLPGGVILVIPKEGDAKYFDACDTELKEILGAARSGALPSGKGSTDPKAALAGA